MTLQQQIGSLFSEYGTIPNSTGFEFRPQQLEMAQTIGRALLSSRHLIIEAPTGVGKSIAYLVPALLFALDHKRKAIVSTYTKNLQEQLFRKDIPLVKKLLGREFTAVILKGRKNYLCTTRLRNTLANQRSLFERKAFQDLERINAWSDTTSDGDVENLPFVPMPEVWQQVCSEQGTCSPKQCGSDCFYQRAKERTRSADLVVLNHALFFSLLALQGSEEYYLYENDFVIFDEAHTLEQVAGIGIGKSISRTQVLFAIHRLYNPRTKKGLISKKKKTQLAELCTEAEESALSFFTDIKQHLTSTNGSSKTIRIRAPHFVANSIAMPLQRLQSAVKDAEENEKISIQKEELSAARRLLWEAQVLIDEFVNQADESSTYWVELGESKASNIILNAAPTSVAESVGPKLFRLDSSVILTSATLSVNGSLHYFQHRMGANDAETAILDSPFDFQRQMRIVIARDIPAPDQPMYEEHLSRWILKAVKRSKGRALILFTSAALLKKMQQATAERIAEEGYSVLIQERGIQRHALLEEFKRDVHSVLFGLDSFWMGVDVPGEALEHVVITRLPFAVPDHPLTEARMELISQNDGNPFIEFTLPEAVLKLRQGVGRLIRNKTDTGIITILDSRIVSKQYGKAFLQSLPRCLIEILSSNGEIQEFLPEYA